MKIFYGIFKGQILRLVFFISIIFCFFQSYSQGTGKPPYPIIFVYGWYGNDPNFEDWIPFLENWGWVNGDAIDVCLDSQHETLMDPVSDLEVTLKMDPDTVYPADYYFLNFTINVNQGLES